MKRYALILSLFAYVALDAMSYIHPVGSLAITPWNPHIGLMLAMFLLRGPIVLPWFLLAAMVSELLIRDTSFGGMTWLVSVVVPTCGYAYLAHAFRRWRGLEFDFHDHRDVLRWLFFALPSTLMLGLLFVSLLAVLGALPWSQWVNAVQRYWVGDWLGIIIVLPLMMVWRRWPEQVPPTTRGQIIGIALFVGLALHVIVGRLGEGPQFQYFYLLFIPLIWATISFSLHGATAVLAAIQISLIALVMIRHVDVSILLSFQLLLFLMAVTGLFLGVSVHERLYTQATLRKRESELNQAINRAAAGELASTLAHELNQPLTALSAYSLAGQQLLQQPDASLEKLADLLAKMRAESQRAGQVVHRLRRFFRSGELHCENIKLSELISQAWEPLIRRADKLHIEFVSSTTDALPLVYADRVQIEIVLYNLLRNAVDAIASLDESTSARVISISARHEDQHVRIIVTDTGCGIPEAQHAHLFDAFNTSKVDGLGLGLNICRTLVESHRGQLWLASSRPGHTRFCFTLPVAEEEPRHS